MLRDLIIAVPALFGLFAAWLAVQAIVRRYMPGIDPKRDALEGMLHDCAHCDDKCGSPHKD